MMNFIKHKLRTKSPGEIIGGGIILVIIIVGLATTFGYVIMRLWNWLMPMIFGLPVLTFWQAAGLFILSKLLLGGIGGGNGGKNKRSSKKCNKEEKKDFSKWKYYEEFWQEEGDAFYKEYLEKKNRPVEKNREE